MTSEAWRDALIAIFSLTFSIFMSSFSIGPSLKLLPFSYEEMEIGETGRA